MWWPSPDRWRAPIRSRSRSSGPCADFDLLLPHLRQLRRTAARRHPDLGLTAREREILELVAEGRTNAEIAAALWISPGTVRKHLENAYGKLGVHTRTAAAALVLRGH